MRCRAHHRLYATRTPRHRPAPHLLIAVWFLLCFAATASAYNEDGHFYTTVAVEHARTPPFQRGEVALRKAVLMGFCAQLPDLSNDFEAVTLRVNLLSSPKSYLWGAFSICAGDQVKDMVQKHHYLHGLTGTAADPVNKAAVATLKALRQQADAAEASIPTNVPPEDRFDPNLVCAMGFAAHLLADSFAHRQLDSPQKMYSPGLGHFQDSHYPDFILYQWDKDNKDRVSQWIELAQQMSETAGAVLGQAQVEALKSLAKENMRKASPGNLFNQTQIIAGLRATLKGATQDDTLDWAPYNPTVESLIAEDGWWNQHVLSRSCNDVVKLYGQQFPAIGRIDCSQVWARYVEEAKRQFGALTIPAKCD